MKKEKRLFIVSNSTHYLNMKNYTASKKGAHNFLILLLKNSKDDKVLLSQVKEDSNIKLIKTLEYNINSRFPFHYFNLISLVNQINKLKKLPFIFDTIFFNNYDSWIQHYIIKQFDVKKIVLISDGTGIFDTVELRKKSRKIFRFSANKFFTNKILRLPPVQNLQFYSPVEIEVAEYDSVEIFNFNSSTTSKVNRNKLYFVGSPLVEKGYLFLNAHLKYLSEIKKKFPGHNIYYLSHRAENAKNLELYGDFGNLIPYTIPFEERLEKAEELPGTIITYLSSVLINLPQVYPQIKFFYVPILAADIPTGSAFRERYSLLIENFKVNQNDNFMVFN